MQGLLFDSAPEVKPDLPGYPAVFSPDRAFRYALWRVWSNPSAPRYLAVIGLNPSTADESNDDPTLRRCIGFAKGLGMDALAMLNLFAFRETSPDAMKQHPDPVGDLNDQWLVDVTSGAETIVAAWGVHGSHLRRAEQVRVLMSAIKKPLHVFGFNNDDSPKHPLYLPSDTRLIEWPREFTAS